MEKPDELIDALGLLATAMSGFYAVKWLNAHMGIEKKCAQCALAGIESISVGVTWQQLLAKCCPKAQEAFTKVRAANQVTQEVSALLDKIEAKYLR